MKKIFFVQQTFKPSKSTIWYFLADVFEIVDNKLVNYNKKLMKPTLRTKQYLSSLPISLTKDWKIKLKHGTGTPLMVVDMLLRAEFGNNNIDVREMN